MTKKRTQRTCVSESIQYTVYMHASVIFVSYLWLCL